MKAMEKTPVLRASCAAYTVTGFFANPALRRQQGQGRLEAPWASRTSFIYKPPFGYYDAQPGWEKA